MKLLSILLRIAAIAGAAFCVYAWLDTKGKISDSMNDMAGITGDTLKAKSVQVPRILKDKAKTESDLKKTEQSLKDTKATLEKTEGELRDERDRVVQAQEEILDKNTQIRSLNSKISSLETTVANSDVEISDLKDEIIKIKSETEPLIADLKEQIVTLEDTVSAKDTEMAEALATAEAEFNEKLEEAQKAAEAAAKSRPAGSKINAATGEVIPAYVPEGEVISILKTNKDNTLFVINKGLESGFALDQKLRLLSEGTFVTELSILIIQDNMAVCGLINKNIGIAETLFPGDILEVSVVKEEESAE